ncbi:hypothetical protein GGS26DRAFT_587586 [Hypomontagnella submonticulosa]|nr:hypothetical protein GGS26DRAFT_587586 [Hypomontagnella submonticulosa]
MSGPHTRFVAYSPPLILLVYFELPARLQDYFRNEEHVGNQADYYVWNAYSNEWGRMKPLRECIATERQRIEEYTRRVRNGERPEMRNLTIIETCIRKHEEWPLIKQVLDEYMRNFPEMVKGSEQLGLQPLWEVVVSSGHNLVFLKLWCLGVIPPEQAPKCMTEALWFAPDLAIATFLADRNVPMSRSDMERLKEWSAVNESTYWLAIHQALHRQMFNPPGFKYC